jgi:hypothetical protein
MYLANPFCSPRRLNERGAVDEIKLNLDASTTASASKAIVDAGFFCNLVDYDIVFA